jgi:hypothetical protein
MGEGGGRGEMTSLELVLWGEEDGGRTGLDCCCAGGFRRDALESGGLAVSAAGVPRGFYFTRYM